MSQIYKGSCFCGEVQIEVEGVPEGMGYCHCASCRSWSAGPVNTFTLWKPEAVSVVKGADKLATFEKTPNSQRQFCTVCGGHVMTGHEGLSLIDVYAATIPSISFEAGLHVNYAETVLPMKDGLPKFADFPTDFGGTGDLIDE
ncbi:aldehyde-activating protein [Rhodobacterales bacterium 52_120_T64]|nr:aldehyde-activating protein [Rhodobacterales bacterium 52_120_T64]